MPLPIAEWVGKVVSVTLRVGGIASAVTLGGKLLQAEEAGVLLDLPKGQTFVPMTSVLHISLLNAR
jgi:hypothetical protein